MSSTTTVIACDRCDQRILGSGQELTVRRAISQGWEVIPRGAAFCPACLKLNQRERVRDGR